MFNEDIDIGEIKMINTNTSLHWGQKYEPVSVLIYENKYKTELYDFGCIQHPIYKFIGASPDGINDDKSSNLYGRMIEIKNVVSREITGIPKKEYWVQMQLQMEVCNLNECDFLETKFIEYLDKYSYDEDIITNINTIIDTNEPEDKDKDKDITEIDTTISADGKQKGIIIHFHKKEGSPFYLYKPLNLKYSAEIDQWEEESIALYQSDKYNYIYVKYIYWKLEKISCILVLRDKNWFKNNIDQLTKIWNIIELERLTGYEHRAPKKRIKKEYKQESIQETGCLLKFNKIIKLN